VNSSSQLSASSPGRRGISRTSLSTTLVLLAATLLLTRQSQVPALGGLAAPFVLLLVVLYTLVQDGLTLLLPMLAYASLSLLAAVFADHELANAIRFFAMKSS